MIVAHGANLFVWFLLGFGPYWRCTRPGLQTWPFFGRVQNCIRPKP